MLAVLGDADARDQARGERDVELVLGAGVEAHVQRRGRRRACERPQHAGQRRRARPRRGRRSSRTARAGRRRATALARRRSARGSAPRRRARGPGRRRRARRAARPRARARPARRGRWPRARRRARRPSSRATPGTRCSCRSRARTAAASPQALATTRWVPSPPSTTSTRAPASAHLGHRPLGVGRRAGQPHRERLELRRRRRVRLEQLCRGRDDSPSPAGIISARSTPAARRPAEHAQHHARLVGVAEHRGARHEPADVAARGGVGDDPHDHSRNPR